MSEKKVPLTDLNLNFIIYINSLCSNLNKQYVFNQKVGFKQITIYLIKLNYNIILNLKELNIFSFKTLNDFTAVNYPGFFKEFELHYFLLSYKLSTKCSLKYFINKEDLVLSFINVYDNSNWLEREVWDLYGVKFIYHKDLRRILTDYGFVGHPLLKMYPLTGFVELRYDDSSDKIVKEKIELTQAFRFFNFFNPWFKPNTNTKNNIR